MRYILLCLPETPEALRFEDELVARIEPESPDEQGGKLSDEEFVSLMIFTVGIQDRYSDITR
jgi:hypothetical protein